ncbi:MerR family transcriptional regulator [Embleya sp. NBC_00896]|uniref:MerR family transcriptional regulator n=1 Tax=Embleya sp. NBC_00896 TaxID=2975961 RepID=UPI0038653DF3|nr:MerR family DNA-binding transcriptional regulator [Embleya sp. NBC_00896]
MLIGELAECTGVSVRLLRYYEQQGMLASTRDANGYRTYDADAVVIVGRIRTLLSAGLCTRRIVDLLPSLRGDPARPVPAADIVNVPAWERARLTADIDRITAERAVLDAMIAAAETAGRSATHGDPAFPERARTGGFAAGRRSR